MTTAARRFGAEGFGSDNLPYASFSAAGSDARLGVRLGDRAIDLAALDDALQRSGVIDFGECVGTIVSATIG